MSAKNKAGWVRRFMEIRRIDGQWTVHAVYQNAKGKTKDIEFPSQNDGPGVGGITKADQLYADKEMGLA